MLVTRLVVTGLAALALSASLPATTQNPPQTPAAPGSDLRVKVTPATLTLKLGESAALKAVVTDAAGRDVPDARVVFASQSRRQLAVTAEGVVTAAEPGTYQVFVTALPAGADEPGGRGGRGGFTALNRTEVTIVVPEPPIATVTLTGVPSRFYAGTRVNLAATVMDEAGRDRNEETIAWNSMNAAVARVDRFGQLQLSAPGTTRITASTGGVTAALDITVAANPVTAFEVSSSVTAARTGDVVRFTATARGANGEPVADIPVHYAVTGEPAHTILGAGATAQVEPDGRFVAERSGRYTVVATTGSHTALSTIEVTPREVSRRVEVVGRGKVLDRHTSDLWVWQGLDGRDYAVTGTWGASGHAFFWDVTDPAAIEKIGEVQVDARTVNDVKVSADGRIAVISREGASNRRNGMVIIDVSNPRAGLPILATFDDELTGGVHNVFIHDNHVYALSAGQRYDIINVEDPKNPRRVGTYQHQGTGGRSSIHDVWVVDGIAYSSNWNNGVVAVDVGGGNKGGSPTSPVKIGSYAYPSGWNHAAYPYVSRSTGKRYIFAGDESFPEGTPTNRAGRADGWIHVIDWTDWDNPREVARYAVEDAGTHNLWVEDDVMYVAYYNGGLRVVDVSGELLGDLGRQGREIAKFYSYDPDSFIPNAPFVWGPQPYKGNIFFSDFNSGLWAVKLGDPVPSRRGESR